MREITLAVVGAHQAGKSTFVRNALDLKKFSDAPLTTKKVSLEGVVSVLHLFEIPLSDVLFSSEHDLIWPGNVGGQTPAIDGALVLYDVTNKDGLSSITDFLSECLLLDQYNLVAITCRLWYAALQHRMRNWNVFLMLT